MLLASPETLPPPAHDAEEIRRGAEEILRRPEFQPPPRSLYQQALDKLGEILGDVIGAVVSGTSGSFLAWGLLLAIVAALTYLVVRGVQSGRARRAPGPASLVDVESDVGLPSTHWDREAERHEHDGRWREALRCRYRALIAGLAGAGVVDEIPGRTAGEYRALVRGTRPQVDEPFSGATDLFERAWYGDEPTGPSESQDFRRLAERVHAGTGP